MGSGRTLWEKLCFAESNPFSRFEDGLQVPLDAVIPTPEVRTLGQPLRGKEVVDADPTAAHGWTYSAEAFLQSPLAGPGSRVAGSDPHVLGLGAYGVAASFHTPAALLAAFEDLHARVGIPRRTRVHVNGPLAPGTGLVDIGLHLVQEAGVGGFPNVILEFEGDVVLNQAPARRKDLAATCAMTGCRSALTPIDRKVLDYYARRDPPVTPTPARRALLEPDPDVAYDELTVVNADQLRPLVARPAQGEVRPVDDWAGRSLRRVAVGGCVAGDEAALHSMAARLEGRHVHAQVEFLIVPESQRILERIESDGTRRALEAAGAYVRRPDELSPFSDVPTLATNTCLHAEAFVASAETCLAAAVKGAFPTGAEVAA